MFMNIAVTRSDEALRRDHSLTERREPAPPGSSLFRRARMSASAPLRHCLMHGGVSEGTVSLVVARATSQGRLTVACFLVDTYCLGVKDATLHELDTREFAASVELMEREAPLARVGPAYARKLLRDVAAWAASNGFNPHRDFAAIEQIFGGINADASPASFTFGRDGGAYSVQRASETRAEIGRRVSHLLEVFGTDTPGALIGA